MTCFNIFSKTSRSVLLTATSIGLLVVAQSAVAGGGSHFDHHGEARGHEFGGHSEGAKPHGLHGDRGDNAPGFFRNSSNPHPQSARFTNMKANKVEDKALAGPAKNTIHPIVTNGP